MPLNHLTGEKIEGMDPIFRVVPAAKYKNLPRLTTTVMEWQGKQFKTEVAVERPVWETALGHAQIAYFEAGADPQHLSYDVIAQEYPRANTVTFVFCAKVHGQDHFVVAPFALAPEQVASLVLTGDWQPLLLV